MQITPIIQADYPQIESQKVSPKYEECVYVCENRSCVNHASFSASAIVEQPLFQLGLLARYGAIVTS